VLAHHSHGCTEAILLEQGFTVVQLGELSHQRLAIWLTAIQKTGFTGILPDCEGEDGSELSVGAGELRQMAHHEEDQRVRKRLVALACLADGKSATDTAAALRISERSLENWR
jgi:hypothetical protein